jgi:hypothetical protein
MLSAAAAAELARLSAEVGMEVTAASRTRLDAVANDARLALVRGALGVDGMAAVASARAVSATGVTGVTGEAAAPLAHAERSLDAAFARLRASEPAAVMSAVRGALADCGYTVANVKSARGSQARVTGRKAGRTIMLELDRRACNLRGDVGGFSSLSCRAELQALNKALIARGLNLGVRVARLHGDPRGGMMLRGEERIPDAQRAQTAPLARTRGR